jgi:prevent-host-death family protein
MRTDTSDLVGVSDAGRNLGRYASEAANGRTLVIVRNNEPTAALVSIGTMDRLSRLDELEEDLRVWSVALIRTMTDSGERYSLESVADELGIDLDELEGDEG